jgi:DNA-binding GntR family transcriptional regulator
VGTDARLVLPGRISTAAQVADLLRERITEGFFPPGSRLSEEELGGALGISRNTLREAFRLLCHERLATHEFHRGVFVRVLSVEDVVDLYRLRRLVECTVVREDRDPLPEAIDAIAAAVDEGQTAARGDRWLDVGTADLKFHQAIAGLAASARINDLIRGVLAELRLVFYVMASPREFHEPYLIRNGEIADLIAAGDHRAAERALRSYLDDAERQLVSAYRERVSARGGEDAGAAAGQSPRGARSVLPRDPWASGRG